VLIIDDCSPDNTPEIAKQLCAEDSRVEYRRHQVNRGHIVTYNEGLLEWAKADYCVLLSADDLLTAGALNRAAFVMDNHPDVGFVYGGAIRFRDSSALSSIAATDGERRILPGTDFIREVCDVGENLIPTPAVVVRTRIQQTAGGYRPELPHSGDLEMWLRLATRGAVGVLDTNQALRRMHGENMCTQYRGLKDLTELKNAFDTFFANDGAALSVSSQCRKQAIRSLAQEAFWRASKAFDRDERPLCDEFLLLSRELDPSMTRTIPWGKLALKRLAGYRIWSIVRSYFRKGASAATS